MLEKADWFAIHRSRQFVLNTLLRTRRGYQNSPAEQEVAPGKLYILGFIDRGILVALN